MKTLQERFDDKWTPEPFSSCWLWTGSTYPYGYGSIKVSGVVEGAHRISWLLHAGQIPHGLCVLHHCDTPACVNPKHLFLGTKTDNARDCARKKRRKVKGERHPMSKLTDENIRQIRLEISDGLINAEIGRRHGVSGAAIYLIRSGKSWSHVQ